MDSIEISTQLSIYFKDTLKEEMNKISDINNDYINDDKEVEEWINKEKDLEEFIKNHKKESNLIENIKKIKLFSLIYKEFTEGKETERDKFNRAKELLDECKIIFTDIYKGNQDILDKWQNIFKKEKDNKAIEAEIKKLKNYYEINEKEGSSDIAKNVLIFTKKNIYKADIKCLQYFLTTLFNVEETDLSTKLNEKKKKLKMKKI